MFRHLSLLSVGGRMDHLGMPTCHGISASPGRAVVNKYTFNNGNVADSVGRPKRHAGGQHGHRHFYGWHAQSLGQ